jgi:hypothetical protein
MGQSLISTGAAAAAQRVAKKGSVHVQVWLSNSGIVGPLDAKVVLPLRCLLDTPRAPKRCSTAFFEFTAKKRAEVREQLNTDQAAEVAAADSEALAEGAAAAVEVQAEEVVNGEVGQQMQVVKGGALKGEGEKMDAKSPRGNSMATVAKVGVLSSLSSSFLSSSLSFSLSSFLSPSRLLPLLLPSLSCCCPIFSIPALLRSCLLPYSHRCFVILAKPTIALVHCRH